jgi:hypothetical protein
MERTPSTPATTGATANWNISDGWIFAYCLAWVLNLFDRRADGPDYKTLVTTKKPDATAACRMAAYGE